MEFTPSPSSIFQNKKIKYNNKKPTKNGIIWINFSKIRKARCTLTPLSLRSARLTSYILLHMEIEKEPAQEKWSIARLLSGLLGQSRPTPGANKPNQSSVGINNEELIANLKAAKNSTSISIEDIAVIDSWIISLETYERKMTSGRTLDRMDLADIAHIRERISAVVR